MDFCAEGLDGLAVDGDMAGADELFARAPGGHAAFSQVFLQANHSKCGMRSAD
jgi:hypothetical protein